jgi:hypothetical protein
VAKNPPPPLKLATGPDATWPEPPRALDNHGRSLWDRIQREYAIVDAGGLELLLLACEGIDRGMGAAAGDCARWRRDPSA